MLFCIKTLTDPEDSIGRDIDNVMFLFSHQLSS